MSAEAKVAQLEGLLARIEGNRRPRPVGVLSALLDAQPPRPDAPADDEPELVIEESETATVVAAKAPTAAATPMEAALAGEVDDDEPELEIVVDDDDEPELVIEEPDAPTAPLGTRAAKPARDAEVTRPLRPQARTGRTVPEKPAARTPAVPARPQPTRPQPSRPEPSKPQPTAKPPSPGAPQRLALADAPAAEVAKVVSQPTAISFADLLDRTLALRPR
ncbi:MAG: hypothetical protein AB8I08_14870 [Sandaracinaceae bacterium]